MSKKTSNDGVPRASFDALRGVAIEPGWCFEFADGPRLIDPLLFALLEGIARGGHLKFASKAAAVSYRHAWGVIRDWERLLGTRLVSLQRGRGASLTAAGTALLDVRTTAHGELRSPLEDASRKASRALREVFGTRRVSAVQIVSSHGGRMLEFREFLVESGHAVGLEILGSEAALARYDSGEADIVGFHLPLGVLASGVAGALLARLSDIRDHVLLVEKRTLGLISRSERPCRKLEQLITERLQFVNRQAGSGTRLVFDALLNAAGLWPQAILGYRDEEYTHTAVTALIASRAADVGFGTRTAADEFKLSFEPLVNEHFYLAFHKDLNLELHARIEEFCRQSGHTETEQRSRPVASELRWTVPALKRLHQVTA